MRRHGTGPEDWRSVRAPIGAVLGLLLVVGFVPFAGCQPDRLVIVTVEQGDAGDVVQLEVTTDLNGAPTWRGPDLVPGQGASLVFPFQLGIYYPRDAQTLTVVVHGIVGGLRVAGGEISFPLPGDVGGVTEGLVLRRCAQPMPMSEQPLPMKACPPPADQNPPMQPLCFDGDGGAPEAGAGRDAGPDAQAPPAECAPYCAKALAACPTMFASLEGCLGLCAASGHAPDELMCLEQHLAFPGLCTEGSLPSPLCGSEPCEIYCRLAVDLCGAQLPADQRDVTSCFAACKASAVDPGAPGDHDVDTIQCRVRWLERALTDDRYCPSALLAPMCGDCRAPGGADGGDAGDADGGVSSS
jgi:hypothetical protein